MRSPFRIGRCTKTVVWVAVGLTLTTMIGCGTVKKEIEEAEAYIYGMESYVYGYPLVMMDVTREVLTAAPAPNAEGTAAPINQLAKMPHYVSPDFKNVVRISLNSLWTTGWVDLEKEPIVLSVPDTKDRYYVFSMMNMWTDVFGSAGKRTTGTNPGNFLIVGPNWQGTAPADIEQTFRSSTRYAWVGESVGCLLWPAAAIHAALTLLLARACFKDRKEGSEIMKLERDG